MGDSKDSSIVATINRQLITKNMSVKTCKECTKALILNGKLVCAQDIHTGNNCMILKLQTHS